MKSEGAPPPPGRTMPSVKSLPVLPWASRTRRPSALVVARHRHEKGGVQARPGQEIHVAGETVADGREELHGEIAPEGRVVLTLKGPHADAGDVRRMDGGEGMQQDR